MRRSHGLVVDPLDTEALGWSILEAISDRSRWTSWQRAGLRATARRFGWDAHARQFVRNVGRIVHARRKDRRKAVAAVATAPARLLDVERGLVTDVDNTLVGDHASLGELLGWLDVRRGQVAFGIATGRTHSSTRSRPLPDSHSSPRRTSGSSR